MPRLAAQTPPASVMARNIGLVLASRTWPSAAADAHELRSFLA